MDRAPSLAELLDSAKNATLGACRGCPRADVAPIRFARSCPKHFASGENGAEAMFITLAPGGSSGGSAETGVICGFCNSDQTARRGVALFMQFRLDCKRIYRSNAVLHGSAAGNAKPTAREIRCCSEVLRLQLQFVKPKTIVAFGRGAAFGLSLALDTITKDELLARMGKPISVGPYTVFTAYHYSPLTRQYDAISQRHWRVMAEYLPRLAHG